MLDIVPSKCVQPLYKCIIGSTRNRVTIKRRARLFLWVCTVGCNVIVLLFSVDKPCSHSCAMIQFLEFNCPRCLH